VTVETTVMDPSRHAARAVQVKFLKAAAGSDELGGCAVQVDGAGAAVKTPY